MSARALFAAAMMLSACPPATAAPPHEVEEAARALLRPVCADPALREAAVAKMIKEGGEFEQQSAKWEFDFACEQIDLSAKPVHDTADPADEASHRDWIYDARWSPDGKFIVTAGRDKTVRIWDVATGKTTLLIDVAKLPQATIPSGKLPPVSDRSNIGMVRRARYFDGGRSIVVTADGHPVRIFDTSTGAPIGEIPYAHAVEDWDSPPFIATAANGLVILGGYGGDIVAYDVKAKAERYRLRGRESEYPHFAVSDAGGLLAFAFPGAGGNALIQVVELETGKPVWTFDAPSGEPHDNSTGAVALSRDGKLLAISFDVWTTVYDIGGKKLAGKVPSHPYFGDNHLAFTADGKGVIGGITSPMLSDIASEKRVRPFGPFSDGFHSADVSPDGKYLVTGHFGSDGRIWDIETGAFFRRLGKDVQPPR